MRDPFILVGKAPLEAPDKGIIVQMDINRHLSEYPSILDTLHMKKVGSDYNSYWYIGHDRVAACSMSQVLRLLQHGLIAEVAIESPALTGSVNYTDGPFFVLTDEGRNPARAVMLTRPVTLTSIKETNYEEEDGR